MVETCVLLSGWPWNRALAIPRLTIVHRSSADRETAPFLRSSTSVAPHPTSTKAAKVLTTTERSIQRP
jgi:hypothetical protein